MKVRLGYLCSSESWGGLEMNHLRNADWMHRRGHDVVVLCIQESPIFKFAKEMELPVILIKQHRKYYDFTKARALKQLVLKEKITHLILRSTRDISIAASVKRKLGTRIQTSYFMEMQIGVKKTNLGHTLRYKYIDVWSCPLNWLKKQVEEFTHFRNQLVVIPSGLELSQFSALPDKDEARKTLELPIEGFFFGLIGRFDKQKGQLLLLEAMSKCRHTDFSVILLGEPTLNEGDDYFKQMKLWIEQHGLEAKVYMRPYRNDTGVFYAAIDWLVMATHAETFGMVTIEALASGRPVLGSNAGGTPEILSNGRGGRLFKTQDSIDLAQQLDMILDEQNDYNSDDLKKIAKVYDHHSICEQVEKVLELG